MSVMALPSKEEQKKLLEDLQASSTLNKGEKWYAIPMKWWETWEALDDTTDPRTLGKIDTSVLFDDAIKGLKREAQEDKDYVLKHEKVWSHLAKWYDTSRVISGNVVERVNGGKPELVIDLHPAKFEISVVDDEEDGEKETGSEEFENQAQENSKPSDNIFVISRYEKMRSLRPGVAKFLETKPEQIDIYVRRAKDQKWQRIDQRDKDDMDQTIGDALPEVGLSFWQLRVKSVSPSRNQVKKPEIIPYRKEKPEIGQRLDARMSKHKRSRSKKDENDSDGEDNDDVGNDDELWYEAKIIGVDSGKREVEVHFLSFEETYDEKFGFDSDRLQPPYSKVADWRTQLRVEEDVDIKIKNSGWVSGEVMKIDRTGEKLNKRRNNSPASKGFRNPLRFLRWGRGSDASDQEKKGDESEDSSEGSTDKAGEKENGKRNSKTRNSEDENVKPVSEYGLVLVSYRESRWSTPKEFIVDLGSELIAQAYTHVEKPKRRFYGFKSDDKKPEQHGVVGLRNLGNTCFMNSSLQCLSHTVPLAEYFLSGQYEKEINRKNPLGTGGKLATAYGRLLKDMFSDKYSTLAPVELKKAVGNAFPSFQGYAQQDAHEFVSLFIDGLHEDLNRVKDKPYTETIESNGRPDEEVAELSWDNYLLRNKSVFVDTMYGLMRSHLVCPDCKNEATKFDAFNTLSVPLPYVDRQLFSIIFVSLPKESTRKHTHYVMECKSGTNGRNVAKWLSEKTGIDLNNIAVVDTYNNRINRVLYRGGVKGDYAVHIRDTRYDEFLAFEMDPISDEILQTAAEEAKAREARRQKRLEKKNRGKEEKVDDGKEHDEGSDDEDSEDERETERSSGVFYMNISYKLEKGSSHRLFCLSDFVRISRGVTNEELIDLIWEHSKFMFKDLKSSSDGNSEKKEEEQDNATPTDLITVYYQRKKVQRNQKEFQRDWKRYSGDRVEVEIQTKGEEMLQDFISTTAGKAFLSRNASVEEKHKNMNVGPIELDETFDLLKPSEKEEITLDKCFEKFRLPEVLGENDEWYCSKCKNHVRATKKMDIWKTGDVLSIHLKRFKGVGYRREKITDKVYFPFELDISDYVLNKDNTHLYELYAVSNHMGGLGGGHYTAYVKVESDWYEMNDSATHKVREDSIVSPSAYVLYYIRKGILNNEQDELKDAQIAGAEDDN